MRCPALTRKGIPCPNVGEPKRSGYCHVHDPNGKFRRQIREKYQRRKRKRRKNNTRQLEITGKRCNFIDYKTGERCHGRKKESELFCSLHKRFFREKKAREASQAMQKRRAKANRKQYVYFFSLGFNNLYKIGKSRNWEQRLIHLQAANPLLDCIKAVEVVNMAAVEKVLHKRFKEHRVERELFRLDDDMADHVYQVMDEYALQITSENA